MSIVNTVIHPFPQLCTRCALFPWASGPSDNESLDEVIPFHKTFKSLQESADQGCALCRFVWSSLVYNCAVVNNPIKSWTEGSIGLTLLTIDSSIAVLSELELGSQVTLYGGGTTFDMVESEEVELLKSMESRQIKAFTAENVRQDLMELTERQIKPWIEACHKQGAYHRSCTRKHNTTSPPTRLVDVGQMNDDMVRLVEVKSSANDEDFAYLILSYCWGNGNANSLTTKENLAKRLHGFAVSDLPQTVRDTIFLTRMMGFRYLWIDAICIIQGPSGDFHAESPKMGDYYSKSACCISASASNDSSEGFLIERPLARYPITHFGIRIAKHSQDGPPYCTYQEINNSPYVKRPLLESPLTKRAWCCQELALPPRILHWTLQGLFLECPSSLFLEDTKIPWEDLDSIKTSTSRLILAMPDENVLFSEGWYRLVALFSRTQLTYENDRLYAIHGLASVLIQRTKSEYFDGLFRRSLAQGLLWYHNNCQGAYPRQKNSRLPSWCWASECPVEYMNIYQTPIYVKDDHPERPLHYPTNFKDMSVVESSVSRLYIRAHIIQLAVERDKHGNIKEKDSDKVFRYFPDRGSRATHPPAPSFKHLFQFGGEMSVLWMPVGRVVNSHSDLVGLLVYKLAKESKETYCRYGILQYEWMWNERVSGDLREVILV